MPKPKPLMITVPRFLGSRKRHAFQPASNFQDSPTVGATIADSLNGFTMCVPCVDQPRCSSSSPGNGQWAIVSTACCLSPDHTRKDSSRGHSGVRSLASGVHKYSILRDQCSPNGCKPSSHSNDPEFWWSMSPLTPGICCQPLEVLPIWWLWTCTPGAKNLYLSYRCVWTSI